MQHHSTKNTSNEAQPLMDSAAQAVQEATLEVAVPTQISEAAQIKHQDIADKIETVSMGLGITSGVVAAGAALAAPTGLGAIGVALGITSAPLIVTAAPLIGAAATVAGVVSGGAYFYSKWKNKKTNNNPNTP